MTVIEARNIGKRYSLHRSNASYRALRDDIMNAFHWFTHGRGKRHYVDEFWALRDIDFSVQQGEVLGIIGPNGSGKSTLLKILSRITPPTTGEVKIRGRVGSLLEVGTGFHPELTGRENIFLNGAILGMGKKEITRKMDEIVAFSGIEKFLDTPVKYYSSGMYVRLAFAIAAHMDPDILLVDEVLAVGDAEFQKKCLGKMEEITKKQGRTILFVSHNLDSIRTLCSRCILLRNGRKIIDEKTDLVINSYLKDIYKENITGYVFKNDLSKEAVITRVEINSGQGNQSGFLADKEINVNVEFEINTPIQALLCLMVTDKENSPYIFSSEKDDRPDNEQSLKSYQKGLYRALITIPPNTFIPGFYDFKLQIDQPFIKTFDITSGLSVIVSEKTRPLGVHWRGKIQVKTAPSISYTITQKT